MSQEKPLIWIMAGESSGDLYGARIAQEVMKQCPAATVRGMGGVRMREAGVDLFIDSSELGVVGFIEVFAHIGTFIRIFFQCIRLAKKDRPDAVMVIDNPGFNIRLAKQLWKLGIPVVWFVSPQVWAWRKSNIPRIAKYCRKLIVIFPFETDVWAGSGLETHFDGHPLIEIVRERIDPSLKRDPNHVLILPGSRGHETSQLLEPFLKTVLILHERRPELYFTISLPREQIYRDVLEGFNRFTRLHPEMKDIRIDVKTGVTPVAIQECTAGLAASGTVTVECAIAGLPLVVAYRLNSITFLFARLVVRKLFRNAFTMVNIILNRKSFEEFLQYQVRPSDMADAMERILPGGSRRAEVEKDMEELRQMLAPGSTNATAKAASHLLSVTKP
ncbi:MAG: lipid-A-disaccharide synthase [Lentisphaeria bacterium]|nr:lipid-A-disaccharide synthase [Lentisphaeria bacterium]